jgi:small GTP-binding protein
MNLSVGMVGLPNSGKSTLFNALLSRQIAQVAEYPFTTIEPNTGVVEVPDERLDKLVQLIKPEKSVPAAIKFVDIAGLVKGAHQGEGLGNKFLSYIREVDAIVHVLRVFENPNVSHVHNKIDPQEDAEIVNLELELAEIKKPMIYVLNVDEKQFTSESVNQLTSKISSQLVNQSSGQLIIICAKLEADLADLSAEERKEYLQEAGVKESGLDKLIKAAYKLLDLITFFTIKGTEPSFAKASGGRGQIQAWPIKQGSTAIQAAEMVHTDFAQGFIKAEVISFNDLEKAESWRKAQELGKTRSEGRDYVVRDGDVVEFKAST